MGLLVNLLSLAKAHMGFHASLLEGTFRATGNPCFAFCQQRETFRIARKLEQQYFHSPASGHQFSGDPLKSSNVGDAKA